MTCSNTNYQGPVKVEHIKYLENWKLCSPGSQLSSQGCTPAEMRAQSWGFLICSRTGSFYLAVAILSAGICPYTSLYIYIHTYIHPHLKHT